MKRKLLAALAVSVMLFSFAACGKTGEDRTTAAAGTTTAPATTAAQTASPGETAPGTTQTQTAAETTSAAPAVSSVPDQSDARTGAETTDAKTTAVPTTKAPSTKASTAAVSTTTAAAKTFTPEQLSAFNGQNGADSYIAYNGVVYNVTGGNWKNGQHHGLSAGKDLTDQINNCFFHPGSFFEDIFSRYPEVGTYTG